MGLGEVELSDFQPEDQDEVRCLILAGLGEHWGQIDESLNLDLLDISASYGRGRTLVVRTAGSTSIIGTGTIVPRDRATAEILRMTVSSDHRRAGLGRLIVEELMATAKAWGAVAVVVETSTHWHEAVSFYRSCGFVITHQETFAFGEGTWFRRPVG